MPTALLVDYVFERSGSIVIASCTTIGAANKLKHEWRGHVRAPILDPTLPESVLSFIYLLLSALSHRFPINVPGSLHVSLASLPYIHSVVSLLSLYSPTTLPPPPLERLPLQDGYMAYLTATHITPLTAI